MQPLWETVGRYLKKLKIELSYDPAILLLGIHHISKDIYINTNVHCSIIYKSQDTEAS